MKARSTLVITVGYLAIIVFTVIAILLSGRNFKVHLPNPEHYETVTVNFDNEGVIENTGISYNDGYTVFDLHSLKEGKTQLTATVYNDNNMLERTTVLYDLTVLPTGVIYLSGYEYGGYQFTVLGMALISVYTFVISAYQFSYRRKKQFFSYKTMLDIAMLSFFGLLSFIYTALFILSIVLSQRADGWYIYNLAGFSMSAVFMVSIPFLVLFSAFLSFSNIALIRREGFAKTNLFGIFISLVLFAGSLLCIITAVKNPNSTVVEMSYVRDAVIRAVVSSGFVYFECILFAAMACTQYAAKYEPKYNQDFIVILGCKVGRDGKPLGLLRGRIDRALEFYNKQLEKTGKKAFFIPSGGQGSDEPVSEALCMKNYLMEKGIPEDEIFPETNSTNTLENMMFSKRIADEHKKNSNILFATTNYHIFRSGIYSAKAGMRADGIGAKTKWYFWPNAQMREFIGLLASEWKTNILFILTIVAVSALFANISTLVSFIAD